MWTISFWATCYGTSSICVPSAFSKRSEKNLSMKIKITRRTRQIQQTTTRSPNKTTRNHSKIRMIRRELKFKLISRVKTRGSNNNSSNNSNNTSNNKYNNSPGNISRRQKKIATINHLSFRRCLIMISNRPSITKTWQAK